MVKLFLKCSLLFATFPTLASSNGSGVFANSNLSIDWHVESTGSGSNGDIIIDSLNLNLNWRPSVSLCQDSFNSTASYGEKFDYCTIWIGLGSIPSISGQETTKNGNKGFTSEEVTAWINNKKGFLSKNYNPVELKNGLCISLIAGNSKSGKYGASVIPSNCTPTGGGIPPIDGGDGGDGGETNPPVCSVSTESISHGVLDANNVDGNSAKGFIKINCNKRASLVIKARGYNPSTGVPLTGNGKLYSYVSIDGISADKPSLAIADLYTTIPVESDLRATSTSDLGGNYKGNIVFTIAYE